MTTIEIQHHHDLILDITDDVRAWLAEQDITDAGIPDNHKLGLHAGRAYFTEGGPIRLGPNFPGLPVGPLPDELAAHGERRLVASTNVGDDHLGVSSIATDRDDLDGLWVKLDQHVIRGAVMHVAPTCVAVEGCTEKAPRYYRFDRPCPKADGTTAWPGDDVDLCVRHMAIFMSESGGPTAREEFERVSATVAR